MTIGEILDAHPLFADLDAPVRALVADHSVTTSFDRDEEVLREGAPADAFYVIVDGRVAVEIDTPRGGRIILETLGPGEILGVSWMLPSRRWTFDARAVEPTTAISVDAAVVRDACDTDPAAGYALLSRFTAVIQERLRAARFQLLDVYGSHVS